MAKVSKGLFRHLRFLYPTANEKRWRSYFSIQRGKHRQIVYADTYDFYGGCKHVGDF